MQTDLSVVTNMLFIVIVLLCTQYSDAGICEECECVPKEEPVLAHCDLNYGKEFTFDNNNDNTNLSLIHIQGYQSVTFAEESFVTSNPLTVVLLLIQNITINKNAFPNLHSLSISHVNVLELKESALNQENMMYSVELENIDTLIMEEKAIENVNTALLELTTINNVYTKGKSINCSAAEFRLINCNVKTLDESGLSISTNVTNIKNCVFEELHNSSIRLTGQEINIINNSFIDLSESSLHLISSAILITNNTFKILPAKSLSNIYTGNKFYFTKNIIHDIDLNVVLLNMNIRINIFEDNKIKCSCAPSLMSILTKEHLTTIEPFQTIMEQNFCDADCNLTLHSFGKSLINGKICEIKTNVLTKEDLCRLNEVQYWDTTQKPNSGAFMCQNSVLLFFSIIILNVVTINNTKMAGYIL